MIGWRFLVRELYHREPDIILTCCAGKRIVELQTSLGLLATRDASITLGKWSKDPHGREPFVHPATTNVEALSVGAKAFFMHHTPMSRLAEEYSIPSVVRWQPKDVSSSHFFREQQTLTLYSLQIYSDQGVTWFMHKHF